MLHSKRLDTISWVAPTHHQKRGQYVGIKPGLEWVAVAQNF
jgi:hypothetical protein